MMRNLFLLVIKEDAFLMEMPTSIMTIEERIYTFDKTLR